MCRGGVHERSLAVGQSVTWVRTHAVAELTTPARRPFDRHPAFCNTWLYESAKGDLALCPLKRAEPGKNHSRISARTRGGVREGRAGPSIAGLRRSWAVRAAAVGHEHQLAVAHAD